MKKRIRPGPQDWAELSGVKVLIDRKRYSPNVINALTNGSYEGGERRIIPKLLAPGDRVLEIGSAIGCVGMVATKIVGPDNIRGFEANPHLVEAARENYQANDLPFNVTNAVLKNRICWAGEGPRVDFYIHRDYWASSLVKAPNTVETVTVPTLCFEEEARKFNANCLVCDIEGGGRNRTP